VNETTTSFASEIKPESGILVVGNQLQINDMQPPFDISVFDMSGKLISKTSATGNSVAIPFQQQGVFVVKVQNKTKTITQKVIY
jgi:hypothetical protein